MSDTVSKSMSTWRMVEDGGSDRLTCGDGFASPQALICSTCALCNGSSLKRQQAVHVRVKLAQLAEQTPLALRGTRLGHHLVSTTMVLRKTATTNNTGEHRVVRMARSAWRARYNRAAKQLGSATPRRFRQPAHDEGAANFHRGPAATVLPTKGARSAFGQPSVRTARFTRQSQRERI